MEMKNRILKDRKISIWGCGYLGYTSTIKFQQAGFFVKVYDFNMSRLESLRNDRYPDVESIDLWTSSGEIPKINVSKVSIASSIHDMFESSVHIVSFPSEDNEKRNLLKKLSDIFVENKDLIDEPLIIFQSAGIPRGIERDFIRSLKNSGVNCLYASAFRSDWVIEEFIDGNKAQVIAGYDEKALAAVSSFMDLLEIKYATLSSIEEAEVYENAQKAIHYTVSGFLNELSLSYPGIDIRRLSKLLVENIEPEEISAGLGTLKYKIANSLDHLIGGVKNENYFSVLKSVQRDNISILFYYCDLIVKKGFKKVCILGLSTKGVFKDVRLSPSVIMAEYLIKLGCKVLIHDPLFSEKEVLDILPYAEFLNIDKKAIDVDVILILRNTGFYRTFSQEDMDLKGITKAKIIIDDTGMFNNYDYSDETLYHVPGDGKLTELIEY